MVTGWWKINLQTGDERAIIEMLVYLALVLNPRVGSGKSEGLGNRRIVYLICQICEVIPIH